MENSNNRVKSIVLWALIFIAFVVTIDLAFIYYQANFNANALPSFCNINSFIDCDGVAKTTESQFFGIPLAYWGLFLYSFIAMLLCVDVLKKVPCLKFLEVFKNKFHYIASLGLISFVISMVLLCVSLFGIHKLCIMCAVTYILDLVIGLVAAHGIKGHFIGAIKQSCIDFLDALKPIPYRIAFIAVVICAISFLYWSYSSAKFSPALQFERNYGEFTRAKFNMYAVKGNILGSKDKNAVVLEVYSDYKCPICSTANIMVHKLAKEFKNLRVEHHNLPLDVKCNKHLRQPFHLNSCILARYGLAAEKQGKFWEVESLLFDKSPFNEHDTIELLKSSGLGLDMDKLKQDANSPEIEKQIQDDIEFAFSKGMVGTPALKIKDDFRMGIKGYPELKKWVIDNGGVLKHNIF